MIVVVVAVVVVVVDVVVGIVVVEVFDKESKLVGNWPHRNRRIHIYRQGVDKGKKNKYIYKHTIILT